MGYKIVAHGTAQSLLPSVDGNVADAVAPVAVEIGNQPLSAHLLHKEFVRLRRLLFVLRPHRHPGNGMGRIELIDSRNLEIRYVAAVRGDKVVFPLMVHCLMLGKTIEECIEHVVEVGRKIAS